MRGLLVALLVWLAAAPAFALTIPVLAVVQPPVSTVPVWSGSSPSILLGAALKAWWDADDTSDGLVVTWTDRVGSLAVTAAGGAQATSSATAFNGVRALVFDGAADCYATTTLTGLPTGASAGGLYAVASNTAAATVSGLRVAIRYGGASGATQRSIGRTSPFSVFNLVNAQDGTTSLTGPIGNLNGPSLIGGDWAGTTETAQANGAAVPGSATIASLNTSTTRLRIGASTGAGCANFWQGPIRHLFVFTTLTTIQRQQLQGWSAWDARIAYLLPYSHPYRFRAP